MSDDEVDGLRARAVTLAELAREEDLGPGDVTSDLLTPGDEPSEFRLIARQACVLAGRSIAGDVLRVYGDDLDLRWADAAGDGARFDRPPVELARVHGSCRSILQAERVLLNFLQRLCGIATLTRAYVEAVRGTTAQVFDTRKTTPGWRVLEKYAVRCGGGHNHRMGLYDAVLIKDNHLAGVPVERLAGHVSDLLNRAAELVPKPKFIAIEADTLEQLGELLKVVGIDVILADNFSLDELRQAVQLRDAQCPDGRVALEASGGITLDTVRAVAETGVDRISVGALTHSAPAVDLGLERGGGRHEGTERGT